MATYSVAMCNLNMAETIEESLRQLLDQIDDRFEIVVVDGGSDDGSVAVLDSLADQYSQLIPVFLDRDPSRTLGEDRNIACQHTSGDYIIDSVDVDDFYYDHALMDFAELFEQLEPHFEHPFRLHGIGVAVSHRSLLVDEYPYRPLDRCEDRDLWRRLFADDRIVWLTHEGVDYSIGYDRNFIEQVRVDIEEKTCDFQAGVTLESCLRYALVPGHYYILERERTLPTTLAKRLYDVLTYPLAYGQALRRRDKFSAPPGFETLAELERTIDKRRLSLDELVEKYDVDVDRLSDEGKRRLGTPRP